MHALFKAARKRWPTKLAMSSREREAVRLKRLQGVFEKAREVGRLTQPARARQFEILKRNGRGKRPVVSFFWVDQARQMMLRSALQPFANLHEDQFMLARERKRRGPAAVREALLAALAECGTETEFLHLDVVNFHGSISQVWLERHLGIDPAVTKRQVHLGGMMIGTTGKMTTVHATHEASDEVDAQNIGAAVCRRQSQEGGQRGIPQGSMLSCLIAEQVMASVIRSAVVFAELPTFIWSDNIGVLVSRRRAGEVVELVQAAFARHGAGPFNLTITRHPVIEEFKFLGVNYRLSGGEAKAYVAQPIVNAWEIAVGSRLLHASPIEIAEIEQHIQNKKAVWKWWFGWPLVEVRLRRMVQAAHDAVGAMGGPVKGV